MADTLTQPSQLRPYDVIILGASGFTGKYVLKEALKFLNSPSSLSSFKTLAIAGRNPTKLTQSLSWATHPDPPPQIPILTADTSDFTSLTNITSLTRVLLNCVGPFRLHGALVLKACLCKGTDYLDISGEPEFMENMEALYHDEALEKGCLMVSACGFDSIPAELGLLFNSRQWVPPSVPNSVEAYLCLESDKRIVGNLGTYESAVLSVANARVLREFRKSRPKRPRPQIIGPRPCKEPTIEHHKEFGLWAIRFPSADAAVVRRTLVTLTENPSGIPGLNETAEQVAKREAFWSTVKPAYFGVNIGTKSFLGILRLITVGLFIWLLGKCSFGRWLLLKFPSVFSLGWFRKKGPTEAEISSANFKMWFVGHGFSDSSSGSLENKKPDTEIVTRVMGPEIGYITTPIILVQCALITLNQRGSLPKGGVLPPGFVFGPTDLQQRLQQNGISFDVISKRALSS